MADVTARSLREAGDDAFREYRFDDAIRLYSDAIGKCDRVLDPALYSRRAAAAIKCKRGAEALVDAEQVISLAPEWSQGWARKGRALLLLHKYDEAQSALAEALRLATEVDNRRKLEYWHELARHGTKHQQAMPASGGERRGVAHEDDFECSLCLKLFYEPVTLACGHTFCRACISRCLDHDDKCPLCREIFYIDPARHPVSITLKNILQKNFAREYQARAQEVLDEERHRDSLLPLFLLDAVTFPGGSFPMHIFEPRYRLMLRRVMSSGKQFGLVGIRPDSSSLHGYAPCDVGCSLQVRACNTLPDGRSIIDTVGRARFRIVDNWEQDGYLVGKVVWLTDQLPVSEAERAQTHRMLEQIVERVRALHTRYAASASCPSLSRLLRKVAEMPAIGTTPESWNQLSYWLCEMLPADLLTKQRLLEIDSCLDRVRVLQQCIESTTNPHAGCQIL